MPEKHTHTRENHPFENKEKKCARSSCKKIWDRKQTNEPEGKYVQDRRNFLTVTSYIEKTRERYIYEEREEQR